MIEFDVKNYIFSYKGLTEFFAELGGLISIVLSAFKLLVPIYALMFFV